MKPIIAKMTVKGQITVPKTIRDWLEIESSDSIEFNMVRRGVVEIQKYKMSAACPFCVGEGVLNDATCNICGGEGTLEPFTNKTLSALFCDFCLKQNQPFTINYDENQPFPIFHLGGETISDDLIYYREVFQLEAVKLYILGDVDVKEIDADSIAQVFLLNESKHIINRTIKTVVSM